MTNDIGAEIDQAGERVWLWSEYRDKELVKLLPGSRWDNDAKQWHAPLSWSTCKAMRGIFGDRLLVGPNLTAWAQREVDERVNPCLELRNAVNGPGDEALYPFQRPGVQFLVTARQALLADEMGTGKTVQVAVALRTLVEMGEDPFPCLVIAPNAVKTHWKRELEKWFPDIDVQVIAGGAAKRRKIIDGIKHVGIINYEATWRHSRLTGYGSIRLKDAEKEPKELNAVPWRTVIVDEAHRIKNPKAKQTRAVWQLGHQDTVLYRWALTGTPMANAPDDLWSILHFVNQREWPAKSKFVDRYCLVSWNPFGGLDVVGIRPVMKDEFYAVLDPRMRRMPKDLVLPFLPPKVRSTREAPMTAKQAKAYKQMEQQMVADLSDDDGESGVDFVAATVPIARATRLMQFSSAFAELNPEGEVRLTDPSNKVDAMMEVIEELEEVVQVHPHRRLRSRLVIVRRDHLVLVEEPAVRTTLPHTPALPLRLHRRRTPRLGQDDGRAVGGIGAGLEEEDDPEDNQDANGLTDHGSENVRHQGLDPIQHRAPPGVGRCSRRLRSRRQRRRG